MSGIVVDEKATEQHHTLVYNCESMAVRVEEGNNHAKKT
jgi:hypothetical protein